MDDAHLMAVVRYFEFNPVAAGDLGPEGGAEWIADHEAALGRPLAPRRPGRKAKAGR